MQNNLTTIYMVRHGTTEWNVKGLTQGFSDSPLTDEGIELAKNLGDKFKNINFDIAFSSDLLRAKRTAEIILLERKIAVETTNLLRERNFDTFEGKPHEEMDQVNEELAKLTDLERYSYKHTKNYESDEEVTTRFLLFIREVAIANPGKSVLVVTHGSFIRLSLMKMGLGTYKSLIPGSIKNGGWVNFETDGIDFFIKEYEGINIQNA